MQAWSAGHLKNKAFIPSDYTQVSQGQHCWLRLLAAMQLNASPKQHLLHRKYNAPYSHSLTASGQATQMLFRTSLLPED